MKQKSAVQTYSGVSPPVRPLTNREKQIVEDHLYLIPKMIFSTVRLNEAVQGLGFDDLYQEGCVALCRAAQTYTGRAAFSTYAGTVIRNHLISCCRSAAIRDRHESLPEDWEKWQASLQDLPDRAESSVTEAIQFLLQANEGCTKPERQGIEALCRKIAGYSCSEIGQALGISRDLVNKQMSCARRKLKSDPDFLRAVR